jgi:hypothetical protein
MMFIPSPLLADINQKIKREYHELTKSFSDTGVLVVIAHLLGIFLGVMLPIAAFHK